MIAWDAKVQTQWAPQVEIAASRMQFCLFCKKSLNWNHLPADWLDLEGTVGYNQTCQNCGGSCFFYLKNGQSWHQTQIARNCPQLFPRQLFQKCPIGDGSQEKMCTVAHTAVLWLSRAVQQAAADHRYVEAFQTYTLAFESILRCAWLLRGLENPNGTIGQLIGKAKAAGYISESDSVPLEEFVRIRNDLTHGDWIEWPHYGGMSIGQEVEGRIWAWWFHQDGYVRSTLALYLTWPSA